MVNIPNTNLILGVLGLGAVFLILRQTTTIGRDLSESITKGVLSGVGTSIEEGFGALGTGIQGGFAAAGEGLTGGLSDLQKSFQDFFAGLGGQPPTPDISDIAGDVIDVGEGTTITIPAETVVDPITGVVTSPTPPILDLGADARARALEALRLGRIRAQKELELAAIPPSEDISGAEFSRARNEAEFRRRQRQAELERMAATPTRIDVVESQLPTPQQFRGGGVSFIGGTIRENPIDTLSEVIEFFPELTASQAADFLAETKGQILPSQVELVDPDIRNIAIAGGDFPSSIQVQTSPLETLSIRETQNIRAAQFTCEQFGLNCELVDSSMA